MTRCTKRRFRTELDARIALALIRRAGEYYERRAYPCPACRGWHLTSQGKNP